MISMSVPLIGSSRTGKTVALHATFNEFYSRRTDFPFVMAVRAELIADKPDSNQFVIPMMIDTLPIGDREKNKIAVKFLTKANNLIELFGKERSDLQNQIQQSDYAILRQLIDGTNAFTAEEAFQLWNGKDYEPFCEVQTIDYKGQNPTQIFGEKINNIFKAHPIFETHPICGLIIIIPTHRLESFDLKVNDTELGFLNDFLTQLKHPACSGIRREDCADIPLVIVKSRFDSTTLAKHYNTSDEGRPDPGKELSGQIDETFQRLQKSLNAYPNITNWPGPIIINPMAAFSEGYILSTREDNKDNPVYGDRDSIEAHYDDFQVRDLMPQIFDYANFIPDLTKKTPDTISQSMSNNSKIGGIVSMDDASKLEYRRNSATSAEIITNFEIESRIPKMNYDREFKPWNSLIPWLYIINHALKDNEINLVSESFDKYLKAPGKKHCYKRVYSDDMFPER